MNNRIGKLGKDDLIGNRKVNKNNKKEMKTDQEKKRRRNGKK